MDILENKNHSLENSTGNDKVAERNWRRFVMFRVLFNSRFYYPVIAVLFLDLGLTAAQYTLLNFAWALAIVVTDVPAGALADRIGRKPLVVGASILMVLEMVLLGLAPRNGGMILVICCLANRVLSGMAEGMASGADEALVFDSLAERNRSSEWPLVLDQVMRWQAIGMVIAMLVGGAVYDPVFMSRIGAPFGWHFDLSATLRFPIYLNLLAALLALVIVLGFCEPKNRLFHATPPTAKISGDSKNALLLTIVEAWKWIARTPIAIFVIVVGVTLDSVVRLFLTFSSAYFRAIALPDASYGVLGAILAGLGMIMAPVARRLAKSGTVAQNYGLIIATVFFSLIGVAFRWQYFGILFVFSLWAAIVVLSYLVSYYLNALADAQRRATILSFKGLAFNVGYGFVSLLFAVVLRAVRDPSHSVEAFASSLWSLPVWLAGVTVICALSFRRYGKLLCKRI